MITAKFRTVRTGNPCPDYRHKPVPIDFTGLLIAAELFSKISEKARFRTIAAHQIIPRRKH